MTCLLDNVWVLEGKLRVSRYQELKELIPYSSYDLGENGVHPTAMGIICQKSLS